MANYRRTPVSYRPFQGQAILADGLLAIERPGGEVARQLANSLFSTARIFGEQADREVASQYARLGRQSVLEHLPGVDVSGGEPIPSPPSASPDGAAPGKPRDDRAPPGTYQPVAPKPKAMAANASAQVRDAMEVASARHGVPLSTMVRIASIETGGTFNPRAKNPHSSAGGLFQQTDANAAQYRVANRFDPYQSADGAARFLRDNIAYLTKRLGRAPTEGELYLAHQQGAGGAAALLTNPAAPAESIVGAKAVTLNGGHTGMTAGEFARMWTKRAGGHAIEAPEPGPSGYTPLSITFTGGGLQLSGRDTIAGRAFDQAASRAYMSALNDAMLTAADAAFHDFGDQPEELAGKLDQLRQEQLDKHVPKELQLDYEVAFNRLKGGMMRRSQDAREKQIDQDQRQAYDGAGRNFNEGLDRSIAGLDPESPESLDIAAGQAARVKDHLRDGVTRGYITQKQADDAAARVDGDVAVAWFTKQAEGRTPEEIAALRKEIRKDYAAGNMPNVDGAAWQRIDTQLIRMESGATADQREALGKVQQVARSIVTRAADGYDIAADEMDALRTAAANVPDGAAIVEDTQTLVDLSQALKGGPIAQAETMLKDLRAKIGKSPTARQAALLQQAEAMVAQTRQALAQDPLGYAANAGVIPDPQTVTDVQSPEDLQRLITLRGDLAARVQAHFGVPAKLFRPGEAAALEGLMKADPVAGAQIAGAVIRGTDRPQDVLKEFGRTAPVLAAAGTIIASSGNVQAAADAIAGSGKQEDGRSYSVKGASARRQAGPDVTGTAMIFQPDDEKRILDTAEWIARKRMADLGMEADDAQADGIYEQAINEAAGATFAGDVQYGGFTAYDPAGFWTGKQQVLVPPNIRADMIYDVIDAVTDADLPVPPKGGAGGLTGYWPVLTSAGYVFVDFDAGGEPLPLEGVDGKPFVLDLEAMAPKIGHRVPGAFRGY